MRRCLSCFGKGKGRTETDEAGENAGVQATEQATTSDVEQPTTSNPSENEEIGGNFTYEELCGLRSTPWFDIIESRRYDWDDEVFIGIHHDQKIAILSIYSQGYESMEFDAAISALKQANHPNLIKVLGYAMEGEGRLVVYEFSNLLSLDTHLYQQRQPLDWNTRMRIALGCAKGLEYLHKTMDPPVIHRNIRSKNVYLDDEFVPKLFDFGLPKKPPSTWRTDFTQITYFLGWKAPEYLVTARSSLLADIYSFGVLLLVIITGREAYDEKKPGDGSLAEWARSAWKTKLDLDEIVDPRIRLQCPTESALDYFGIALSCIILNPSIRPDISEVCRRLERIAGGSTALHHGRTIIPPAEERAASSSSPPS